MSNSQNGSISPLLLALIAVLLIGGGAYVYVQNKPANQPAATTSTTHLKGWLEGKTDNWILAETTTSLYGYSGRRFSLKFNDKSNCVAYNNNGDPKSFPCLSNNLSTHWGYGDRVRVIGIIGTDNDAEVINMEIVSSLPVANW